MRKLYVNKKEFLEAFGEEGLQKLIDNSYKCQLDLYTLISWINLSEFWFSKYDGSFDGADLPYLSEHEGYIQVSPREFLEEFLGKSLTVKDVYFSHTVDEDFLVTLEKIIQFLNLNRRSYWKDVNHFNRCSLPESKNFLDEEGDLNGSTNSSTIEGLTEVSIEEFYTLLKEYYGEPVLTFNPKPRYRKPRIKPLKRVKTDIIVIYSTGEKYTLKNVSYLSLTHEIKITTDIKSTEDVTVYMDSAINRDSVIGLKILSPEGNKFISVSSEGYSDFSNEGYSFVGANSLYKSFK